ncbi:hypothetical protein [Actinomadura atramentaria]|uniref:hypothetical protein n=1 Tax=Actinomadura atramentaria TaxID=1990 RepID=UPI00039E4791|nr:hypothetical protein [Actinomadura atramentaria]
MNPVIASMIPLVCRPKPPGLPLTDRITKLTALTVQPPDAGHHQLVARASGVLNYAALIASDVGLPDLAAALCWRQHRIFAEAGHLDQDTAVMALMPLVNIARLLIREGDGGSAFDILQRLYQAAQQRGTTVIADHDIDFGPLIQTDDDHRKICTELWITVLTDGARALARQGRWIEAADALATHRGIGNRLLDGRQIKIMSLLEQGRTQQAIETVESSSPTEPWETAVAEILLISCHPKAPSALDHVVSQTLTLIGRYEPTTAAFRTRLALATLDLTTNRPHCGTAELRDATVQVASTDSYAARDVLAHSVVRAQLRAGQEQTLAAVLALSGLGSKTLSEPQMEVFSRAGRTAEGQLRNLLARRPRTV